MPVRPVPGAVMARGSVLTMTASTALDARYGRTPRKKHRDRIAYIAVALVMAVVVSAWVIWAGLDQPGASLESEDVGNMVLNSRTVQVNYQVSVPIGTTAKCALQAQNSTHAITGWLIVDLPASKQFTNGYSSVVKSTEKPATGLIYQCWRT